MRADGLEEIVKNNPVSIIYILNCSPDFALKTDIKAVKTWETIER